MPTLTLFAPLRHRSHSPEDLMKRTLRYIKCSPRERTWVQRKAFTLLRKYFQDPDAFADLEMSLVQGLDNTTKSQLIKAIGDLFLLKGLDDVDFEFEYKPTRAERDNIIGFTFMTPYMCDLVVFNAGHPEYRHKDLSGRRDQLFGSLFHEGSHVIFGRYLKLIAIEESPTGHHIGWNMVTATI